ncbi:uncharacterized protein SPPG_03988 [Spizellomyces punctatus DAOM BR117]|uniref:Uncharacterized protein n=1 Tax=Spizellomyces punctatus (strain DAOM BR117) TaxID=645134 RepID=A0A0L0HIK6_SPIPD|nr:uncharacterized protein SPPG_03988 [Spizellomyces punctatus DAOM BR117]KND00888.1 hypothetical protein SPPG_03988 [Spizellomyces punctatus DAOM BR117]|eukprot:XP_016608927.1 hypothetical protein SPPG_03988 [Spizellomyces punctatus DAOM BR117]
MRPVAPLVVPESSLWHPNHNHIIGALIQDLLSSEPPATAQVERHVLTKILPYVLFQFAPELYKTDQTKGHESAKSSRLQAARAVLIALNYSLSLPNEVLFESPNETKFSGRINDGKEIRLLLLNAFTLLCKRIDGEKLWLLFTQKTQLARVDSSKKQPNTEHATVNASARIDIVVRSILSLIEDVPILPRKKKHNDLGSLCWRARECLRDLLIALRRIAKVPQLDRLHSRLSLLEEFACVLLKGLRRNERKPNLYSRLKLQITLYADMILLLPATMPARVPPSNVHLLAHPLLLLRHVFVPILRLTVWNVEATSHGAQAFRNLRAYILVWAEDENGHLDDMSNILTEDRLTLSISDSKHLLKHTSILLVLLADFFTNASRSHAKEILPAADKKRFMPILLTDNITRDLVRWTLSGYTTRMVQLFLLPLLEQLSATEDNWKLCERIIVSVYNGRLGSNEDEQDHFLSVNDSIDSTVQCLTKWLITNACWRYNHSDDDADEIAGVTRRMVGKLPSQEARLRVRIFCIKLLGRIPNDNQQITNCILSLFDDPSLKIRLAAAHAINVRRSHTKSEYREINRPGLETQDQVGSWGATAGPKDRPMAQSVMKNVLSKHADCKSEPRHKDVKIKVRAKDKEPGTRFEQMSRSDRSSLQPGPAEPTSRPDRAGEETELIHDFYEYLKDQTTNDVGFVVRELAGRDDRMEQMEYRVEAGVQQINKKPERQSIETKDLNIDSGFATDEPHIYSPSVPSPTSYIGSRVKRSLSIPSGRAYLHDAFLQVTGTTLRGSLNLDTPTKGNCGPHINPPVGLGPDFQRLDELVEEQISRIDRIMNHDRTHESNGTGHVNDVNPDASPNRPSASFSDLLGDRAINLRKLEDTIDVDAEGAAQLRHPRPTPLDAYPGLPRPQRSHIKSATSSLISPIGSSDNEDVDAEMQLDEILSEEDGNDIFEDDTMKGMEQGINSAVDDIAQGERLPATLNVNHVSGVILHDQSFGIQSIHSHSKGSLMDQGVESDLNVASDKLVADDAHVPDNVALVPSVVDDAAGRLVPDNKAQSSPNVREKIKEENVDACKGTEIVERNNTNGESTFVLDVQTDATDHVQHYDLATRFAHHTSSSFTSLLAPFYQNAPPTFIRPRLRNAVDMVLKAIVFSRNLDAQIEYRSGRLSAPSEDEEGSDKSNASNAQRLHPLHPLLKGVFSLDPILLLQYCSTLDMTDLARAVSLHKTAQWHEGLTVIHRHLLPLSRILFELEAQLHEHLTEAQALVIVRDQVTVVKLTCREENALRDVSGSLGNLIGAGDGSFLRWVEAEIK